jgi:ABC-type polysaccharide/polyol phosphate export permease
VATKVIGRFGAHRHLFLSFVGRELRNRYVGSISGALWALLHPIAQLAIFAFIFAAIFRSRAGNLDESQYIAFYACGLWPWLAFREGLARGTASLQGAAQLIKKIAFPNELIVAAAVTATFIVHIGGFLIALIVLKVFGQPIDFLGLPVAALACGALLLASLGLAFALSAIQLIIRDVEQALGPILDLLFFLTPILYPLAAVPKDLQPVVAANPLTFVLERLHDALVFNPSLPTLEDAAMIAVATLILLAGYAVFRRLAPHFEDFV